MKVCLYSVSLELCPPRRVSLNSTPLPKPGSWECAIPNLCPQWSAFLFRTSWNSWEKRTFPGATGPNTEGPRGTRNKMQVDQRRDLPTEVLSLQISYTADPDGLSDFFCPFLSPPVGVCL